jgi:hypothetical protein
LRVSFGGLNRSDYVKKNVRQHQTDNKHTSSYSLKSQNLISLYSGHSTEPSCQSLRTLSLESKPLLTQQPTLFIAPITKLCGNNLESRAVSLASFRVYADRKRKRPTQGSTCPARIMLCPSIAGPSSQLPALAPIPFATRMARESGSACRIDCSA